MKVGLAPMQQTFRWSLAYLVAEALVITCHIPGTEALALTCGVAGTNASLVDIATDSCDPLNEADSGPSIAVNAMDPNKIKIVVLTQSDPWGPGMMAPVWKSDDGGTTWRKVPQIPQPKPNSQGPVDLKIALDASGKLYIAAAADPATLSPPEDFVFSQSAGPDDSLTPGKPYGDDQPQLEIDKSVGTCSQHVYSPWLNLNTAESMVSFSVDGGTNITDVEVGDNSFQNRTTRIALGPDGTAYVVYKKRINTLTDVWENAFFIVNRSDDCGQHWNRLGSPIGDTGLTTGVSITGSSMVETFYTIYFGNRNKGKVTQARSSDAWIAVGPNGPAYVAYVNKDNSGFGQIHVAKSTDKGMTWCSTRVTDGTHNSAFPEIAVANVADNDVLGVLYLDYDDSQSTTVFRYHFAIGSIRTSGTSCSSSWKDEILQSFDPNVLQNTPTICRYNNDPLNCFYVGDFQGLTSAGSYFYGAFSGQSIGRTMSQLDPIFFKKPASSSVPPASPTGLRVQ